MLLEKLIKAEVKLEGPKTLGKIDLEVKAPKPKEEKSKQAVKKEVSAPVKEETTIKKLKVVEIDEVKASEVDLNQVLLTKEVSAPVKKEISQQLNKKKNSQLSC